MDHHFNFIFMLMKSVAAYFSVPWQSESFTWIFPVCPSESGKSLLRTFRTNRRTTNSNSQISYTQTCSPGIGEHIYVWHDSIW